MLQTYRQTDRQTYRPSDEVDCRGAFAPNNINEVKVVAQEWFKGVKK